MGLISSKISSRPDERGTSVPPWTAASTRACQAGFPISQSKDSVCKAKRLGTSRGSRILAKEIRVGTAGRAVEREAAKAFLPGVVPYGAHTDGAAAKTATRRMGSAKQQRTRMARRCPPRGPVGTSNSRQGPGTATGTRRGRGSSSPAAGDHRLREGDTEPTEG